MGWEAIKAKRKPQFSIHSNNLALSEVKGLKHLSVIVEQSVGSTLLSRPLHSDEEGEAGLDPKHRKLYLFR